MEETNETIQSSLVGVQSNLSEQEAELYSQKAIDGFSLLMAPIFGSVMFAMNLKRLNKTEGVYPVITFGVGYFIFTIYFSENVSDKIPVHLWNAVGSLALHYYFWKNILVTKLNFEKGRSGNRLSLQH